MLEMQGMVSNKSDASSDWTKEDWTTLDQRTALDTVSGMLPWLSMVWPTQSQTFMEDFYIMALFGNKI